MKFDISIDTEALVVDAYPKMKEIESNTVDAIEFDVAWGFYCAMHKLHPEMMKAFSGRMLELIKAVWDIENQNNHDNPWFTEAELRWNGTTVTDLKGNKP